MAEEFQTLLAEDIEAVLENEELYEDYVDSLMLLHDLLCEFSASQGQPRFTSADVEGQIQRLVKEPLVRKHPKICGNVLTNYKAAKTIRERAGQSQTVEAAFAVEQEASRFLEALLRTYRTLRTSKDKVKLD